MRLRRRNGKESADRDGYTVKDELCVEFADFFPKEK